MDDPILLVCHFFQVYLKIQHNSNQNTGKLFPTYQQTDSGVYMARETIRIVNIIMKEKNKVRRSYYLILRLTTKLP